ncbi:helix-turn-helix domain-containing protein [Bauldia sp.]|uniref:helix-turn-helix domain-containing protein n=1 Tax=Bauldia sp. TaxID=2575872 RepID=UPI003BAA662C
MDTPEAFTVFQDFPPAPQQPFRMDRHYLLYASRGTMRLEADGRDWTLPPARAALIAADKEVLITLPQPLTACSVLFAPDFVEAPPAPLAVFDISPLARELVMETRAWGRDAGPLSPYAASVYTTLAQVTWRLSTRPSPAVMPAGQSEAVRKALETMRATIAESATLEGIADSVGVSPRSLTRKFSAELGMSWGEALRRLRILEAIGLVAGTDMPITEVSLAVGYNALSAFNAAFRDLTGMTPTAYRQRSQSA